MYRRHVVCADEPFLFLAPSGSSRASVQPVPTHCTDNNVAVSLLPLQMFNYKRWGAGRSGVAPGAAPFHSTGIACVNRSNVRFSRNRRVFPVYAGTLHLGCRCRQNPPQRCYLLLRRRKRHLISNAVSPHLNTGWSFISLRLPSSAAVIAIWRRLQMMSECPVRTSLRQGSVRDQRHRKSSCAHARSLLLDPFASSWPSENVVVDKRASMTDLSPTLKFLEWLFMVWFSWLATQSVPMVWFISWLRWSNFLACSSEGLWLVV